MTCTGGRSRGTHHGNDKAGGNLGRGVVRPRSRHAKATRGGASEQGDNDDEDDGVLFVHHPGAVHEECAGGDAGEGVEDKGRSDPCAVSSDSMVLFMLSPSTTATAHVLSPPPPPVLVPNRISGMNGTYN